MTIEERIQRIKSVLSQDNQMIFFVEHESRLGGFLGAYSGDFHRNRYFARFYGLTGTRWLSLESGTTPNCSGGLIENRPDYEI